MISEHIAAYLTSFPYCVQTSGSVIVVSFLCPFCHCYCNQCLRFSQHLLNALWLLSSLQWSQAMSPIQSSMFSPFLSHRSSTLGTPWIWQLQWLGCSSMDVRCLLPAGCCLANWLPNKADNGQTLPISPLAEGWISPLFLLQPLNFTKL